MKNTLAVVINGAAGVGKDMFVTYCRRHLDGAGISTGLVSSVDKVKQAAKLLGWDGVKDEVGRYFLHELKMLSTKYYDGPMKMMSEIMESGRYDVVFLMIREPSEISRFVEKYPETITVLVTREGAEQFNNEADSGVYDYVYGLTIENNGTLIDFEMAAKSLAFAIYGEA